MLSALLMMLYMVLPVEPQVELMDQMYIKAVLNIKPEEHNTKPEEHNTKPVEHFIKLHLNIKLVVNIKLAVKE